MTAYTPPAPFSYGPLESSPDDPPINNYYGVRTGRRGVYPTWELAKQAGGWSRVRGAFWMIEGFRTLEEAQAYVAGYDSRLQWCWTILSVVHEAVRRFKRREYRFPTEYRIVPGIPDIPGLPGPPSPSDILPWPRFITTATAGHATNPQIFRSPNEHTTPHNPRSSPYSFSRNAELNLPDALDSLDLGGRQTNRSPSPRRHGYDSSLRNIPHPPTNRQNSPSDSMDNAHADLDACIPLHRPGDTRFPLSFHMRFYLLAHQRNMTPQQCDAVESFISSIPGRNSESVYLVHRMLRDNMGMSDIHAVFYTSWVFDICPGDSMWHPED